jgi:lipopolysaccharide export system protein LptA
MKTIGLAAALVLAGLAQQAGAGGSPLAAKHASRAVSPSAAPNLGPHNSNAPINVSSDNFVGNFATKVGTYTGNVIVTQADYKLRADTVKVSVVQGKPSRFNAAGKVVFMSSSGVATGDTGVYDLGPRTVTLTGHVVLTKDKDVMHGTALVVNMVNGEAHLSAQGAPGNRVQGLFVPQQQSSAKAGQPGTPRGVGQ